MRTQFVHSTLSEYDQIPISILWDNPEDPGIVTWEPGESLMISKHIAGSSKNDLYMMGFAESTLSIGLILLRSDYPALLAARQGRGNLIIPVNMADGTGTDVVIQGEIYHVYDCSLTEITSPIFITDDESVQLTANFIRSG